MKLLLCQDLWSLINSTEPALKETNTAQTKLRYKSHQNKAFGIIGLAIEDSLKDYIIECEKKIKKALILKTVARLTAMQR